MKRVYTIKPCNKKPMPKILADVIVFKSTNKRMKYGDTVRNENRSYFCHQCQAWHTTSQEFRRNV